MSGPATPEGSGARVATTGTPRPVAFERDREARRVFAVLLAGPLIGMAHFMAVYLVAEAGCTGDGPGLDVFDPPVPRLVTLGATVVAAAACLAAAAWAWRFRDPRLEVAQREGGAASGADGKAPLPALALAGALLSGVFFLGVLFIGVPALFLPSC